MFNITEFMATVHQFLSERKIDAESVQQYEFPLPADITFPALDWLASQQFYPQFYWYHRDGHEEAVLLGEVKRFLNISAAEQFLQQQTVSTIMRIWGLIAWQPLPDNEYYADFVGHDSYLFLPRIEFYYCHGKWILAINIIDQQDLLQALQFLSKLKSVNPILPINSSIKQIKHLPEYQQWEDLTTQAVKLINRGIMDKVVVARQTDIKLTKPLNGASLLSASKAVNFQCYHFMISFNHQHAFLSSTPERLYYRKFQQLYTEALAGTVVNSSDPIVRKANSDWLMNDDKNQHENLLVVDDICQRWQDNCEKIDVSQADIILLRKIQHLRRFIHITLQHVSDSDCLYRLQPTASVAGVPRKIAKYFLQQNEPICRGWYAGNAGYLSLNQSEFIVSLRCAHINNDQLRLYAGAGIVNNSDPWKEWLEVENKAAGLQTLINTEIFCFES
ncbi:MAG: isochorismate synthase [Arsenophonus sp.]